MMKRYLLFGGDKYYACGGVKDLKGSFDTASEAMERFTSYAPEEYTDAWAHIVDHKDMSIICECNFDDDTALKWTSGDEATITKNNK